MYFTCTWYEKHLGQSLPSEFIIDLSYWKIQTSNKFVLPTINFKTWHDLLFDYLFGSMGSFTSS